MRAGVGVAVADCTERRAPYGHTLAVINTEASQLGSRRPYLAFAKCLI